MDRAGAVHVVPYVNAPVADLPVRRIVSAHHFIADLTLPYGRVLHDYLQEGWAGAFRERALVPLHRHAVEQCG